MNELLYDLSLGIVNIEEKRLSHEQIDKICERGYAFKIKSKFLVGRKYLKQCFLQQMASGISSLDSLEIKGHAISPSLVRRILQEMASEKILIQEESRYRIDFSAIINEQTVEDLFKYRIDSMKIEDLGVHFGLKIWTKNQLKDDVYTQAGQHCSQVLQTLRTANKIMSDPHNPSLFYWNFNLS